MTTAARTEFPAAERFSERINSDEENAELPDMQELSPLRAESAKQIAATADSCFERRQNRRPASESLATGGQKRPLVLRFDAWPFSTF